MWQHRHQGAARQHSVTDLATTGTAHEAHLADREGREVVVQEKLLVRITFEALDQLSVAPSTQGDRGECLSLAALKQRGAVGTGQDPSLDVEVAYLIGLAPVEADAALEYGLPEQVLLEGVHDLLDLARQLLVVLGKGAEIARYHRLDRSAPFELGRECAGPCRGPPRWPS